MQTKKSGFLQLKREDPLPQVLIAFVMDILFHTGTISERNYHVYKDYFVYGKSLEEIAEKYDWKEKKVKRILDATRDSLVNGHEKITPLFTSEWIKAIQLLDKSNIFPVEMLACVYKKHAAAIPLRAFDLSVRAFSLLKKNKILFASELILFTEADLFQKGFAKKNICEIKDALAERNLVLKK